MCNNPYMLLSHYEILACGTALRKLLHLTVFAQGLLINSPFEWRSVSQADSTCQWWERDRERKVDWTREEGYHSSITIYRVTIPTPLVQRQDLSLSLSLSGWMVPPQHTILLSQIQCPLQPPPLFFPLTPASSPLPPHLLRQCRLPCWSHNPLSCPGSLALTTVHPPLL